MEQGTEEWKQARCGKVTASRIADLMATTRTGYGASRANYMADLIVERLTGLPNEGYINADMQWGIDHEPDARAAYEFMTGEEVELIAFVDHPGIQLAGASPDGRVTDKGLVEFKCPKTATHIEYLLSRSVPDKYIKQMQWQMACEDRQWCDFMSFDPRLPEEYRIFLTRIERNNDLIQTIEAEVTKFLAELDAKIAQLQQLTQKAAA